MSVISKSAESYRVDIYSSGPIDVAKQILRLECLRQGLCVTISPTTYIYTGGEEEGFVVGLVNYPRFPATEQEIWDRARTVALALLHGCAQHSILLQSPHVAEWLTKRETA